MFSLTIKGTTRKTKTALNVWSRLVAEELKSKQDIERHSELATAGSDLPPPGWRAHGGGGRSSQQSCSLGTLGSGGWSHEEAQPGGEQWGEEPCSPFPQPSLLPGAKPRGKLETAWGSEVSRAGEEWNWRPKDWRSHYGGARHCSSQLLPEAQQLYLKKMNLRLWKECVYTYNWVTLLYSSD